MKVSVIVPIYNQERFLPLCLNSLLHQTFKDFEVLLANDGSTDSSLEICQRYAARDSRFRIIHYPSNHGICFIRADTLPQTRGEYVALLDSDDLFRPTRLEKQVAYLNAHPDVVLLGNNYHYIDSTGKRLHTERLPLHDEQLRWRAIWGNELPTPAITFRREAGIACGGFDANLLIGEDADFSSRILLMGRAAVNNEVLYEYRMHPKSIMKNQDNRKRITYHQIVQTSIQNHLGLQVPLPVARAASNSAIEPAATLQICQDALALINQSVNIMSSSKYYQSAPSKKLLGSAAMYTLLKLGARNQRETWWAEIENEWKSSVRALQQLGYQWKTDWPLISSFHPRRSLWRLFA